MNEAQQIEALNTWHARQAAVMDHYRSSVPHVFEVCLISNPVNIANDNSGFTGLILSMIRPIGVGLDIRTIGC